MNIYFYIKLVERLIPRRLLCKLSYTTMHACPTSTQHHPNLAGSLQISHSEKGHSWLFFFISHFFWGAKRGKSHEKFKTTENFRSPCSAPRWSSLSKLLPKHGENIVGKFTNASEIGVSLVFHSRFLAILLHNCRNSAFGWSDDLPSIRSFSGICLKSSNFLKSSVLSRSATHEAICTFTFGDNIVVPIHLLWMEIVRKCTWTWLTMKFFFLSQGKNNAFSP